MSTRNEVQCVQVKWADSDWSQNSIFYVMKQRQVYDWLKYNVGEFNTDWWWVYRGTVELPVGPDAVAFSLRFGVT